MTTALIADDEPALSRALVSMLSKLWPELQIVHVARHGIEAAAHIASLQPDIAFLDIQMPGLSGLEVAQGIEGRTQVVFVTAYDQHAVQAFEHAAVDYLLKPLQPERLARTIERLRQSTQPVIIGPDDQRLLQVLRQLTPAAPGQAPLRWVRASSGDVTHQIDVQDILFFQADDKYTCVRTVQTEHLIRTPIAELAQQLDPHQFQQVHRATLINLARLAGTRRDETSRLWLRMQGWPGELPVSRAYVHLFKAM
jgi:DNA-binding LytR/AlgR family response regulator